MVKNESQKTRFNIFDIIIIIAVIACIAGVVVRARFSSSAMQNDECECEFVISAVLPETADKLTKTLKSGEKLYLSSNDSEVGYIVNSSSEQASIYVTAFDGSLLSVDDPTHKNVVGKCVLLGKKSDSGFFIGGNQLATVGDIVYVYSTSAEFALTLTGVSDGK